MPITGPISIEERSKTELDTSEADSPTYVIPSNSRNTPTIFDMQARNRKKLLRKVTLGHQGSDAGQTNQSFLDYSFDF